MCVVNFNFQWDTILKTVRKRSLYVISNHKRKFFTIPSDYIISLNRTLYIKSCIQNMSDQLSLSYWRTILSGSKIFSITKVQTEGTLQCIITWRVMFTTFFLLVCRRLRLKNKYTLCMQNLAKNSLYLNSSRLISV
jgi:hypothetical protein